MRGAAEDLVQYTPADRAEVRTDLVGQITGHEAEGTAATDGSANYSVPDPVATETADYINRIVVHRPSLLEPQSARVVHFQFERLIVGCAEKINAHRRARVAGERPIIGETGTRQEDQSNQEER